jgi:hypothetical protein
MGSKGFEPLLPAEEGEELSCDVDVFYSNFV